MISKRHFALNRCSLFVVLSELLLVYGSYDTVKRRLTSLNSSPDPSVLWSVYIGLNIQSA